MMDYQQLLTDSYLASETVASEPVSRLEFLANAVFEFTTYDREMSETLARKALEVCGALNRDTTQEYIADVPDYLWYIIMCNMPFFAHRIDWGTSIRGAWWDTGNSGFELQSCGLWMDVKQLCDAIKFTRDEWILFIDAITEFAKG